MSLLIQDIRILKIKIVFDIASINGQLLYGTAENVIGATEVPNELIQYKGDATQNESYFESINYYIYKNGK